MLQKLKLASPDQAVISMFKKTGLWAMQKGAYL